MQHISRVILILLLFPTMVTSQQILPSVFEDDMESYMLGSPVDRSGWYEGGDYLIATNEQYYSGSQSGQIPNDGVSSVHVDLRNVIFGLWWIYFRIYIPQNAEASLRLQGELPVLPEYPVGQFYFNKDRTSPNTGYIDLNSSNPSDWIYFTYPEDEWFSVYMAIDLTSGVTLAEWSLDIAEKEVIPHSTPFEDILATTPSSLGSLNFFSSSLNTNYYIDDVIIGKPPLTSIADSKSDHGLEFIYNSKQQILLGTASESIKEITIYDALGKKLYYFPTNAPNFDINMEVVPNGVYLVKFSFNSSEAMRRIVK